MRLAMKLLSLPLFVMVFAVVSAPGVGAQPGGTFTINHFNIYADLIRPTLGTTVTLRDQFGEDNHLVQNLEWFGVPVDKNGEGIIDTRAHLTWWRISPGDNFGPRRVVVQNQFGDQTLDVGVPSYLLNPALKNSTGQEPLPDDTHDHYKCYDAIPDQQLSLSVSLLDQYGLDLDVVLFAQFLCNPAEKETADGVVHPINKPQEHLVCYRIESFDPSPVPALATDQFGVWQMELQARYMLCVPSLKDEVVQTNEGTWGEIKSTYR